MSIRSWSYGARDAYAASEIDDGAVTVGVKVDGHYIWSRTYTDIPIMWDALTAPPARGMYDRVNWDD